MWNMDEHGPFMDELLKQKLAIRHIYVHVCPRVPITTWDW